MVYDGATPVGAAACFLMEYSLDTTVQGPLKAVAAAIKRIVPRAFTLRALVCGQPMGRGRLGVAGEGRRMVRAVCDAMEQLARQERVGILAFKDFDESYTTLLAGLQDEGFCRVRNLPTTELDIRFPNFEEYLKSLSRVSRDGLKRKFKQVDAGVPIALEVADRLDDGALDETYALYLQTVAHNHEMQFEIVPKAFFVEMARRLPGQAKFFLWRLDGRLIAFAFCLVSGELFHDYYLGFDYAVAHQYHLYFVRFRDLVRWCIAHRIPRYEMGQTVYEPKRRLGFTFVPLHIYAKHRRRWLNLAFKLLCAWLEPERFDPALRVLRRKRAAA